MLRFDLATGLYAEATEVIRESVRKDWVDAFALEEGSPPLDTDPATPSGQLIDSQTALTAQKDTEVLTMANQFNPLTAEGVWQDALGQIYFLNRHLEESSLVPCLCKGLKGTEIFAGDVVKSKVDGALFTALSGGTIPAGGQLILMFAAQKSGPIAVPAESVNTIVTVRPGWDSVLNSTAGSPGRYAETRAEFEQRRADSVAKNAHGTVPSIYGYLADLQGVLSVEVLENTATVSVVKWGVTIPGHSVYIAIHGGDDAAIAESIFRKKDGGCGTAGNTLVKYVDTASLGNPEYEYKIERGDALPFGVQVNIRLTPDTPADIKTKVQKAVADNFNGLDKDLRVKMASVVYASRFYAPVIKAGVQDLVSVKIAAPAGDGWVDEVTVRADQVPVLEEKDVDVNILGKA